MNDPLESPRDLIANAKHHVANFIATYGAFLENAQNIEIVENDLKTGEQIHKLRLTTPIPRNLNSIAFDAVNNFRSALDNIGYAVSVANGGKGESTYFPFGGNAGEVAKRRNNKSREIPQEIFTVMESFKPYKGGNDLLWSLNKLANTKKHRFIHVTGGVVGAVHGVATVYKGRIPKMPKWDTEKNEIEIFRVQPPDGYVRCNMQLHITIAFNQIHALFGKPAGIVLEAFGREVDSILMAVEAEATKIGLFK